MRLFRLLLSVPFLIGLSLAAETKNCGCACCKGKEVCCCNAEKSPKEEGHPLKGLVLDVKTEKGALLVKHEAIPGFMGAMTMLFQVDAAELKRVSKGDRIEAVIYTKDDMWRLRDIRISTEATGK